MKRHGRQRQTHSTRSHADPNAPLPVPPDLSSTSSAPYMEPVESPPSFAELTLDPDKPNKNSAKRNAARDHKAEDTVKSNEGVLSTQKSEGRVDPSSPNPPTAFATRRKASKRKRNRATEVNTKDVSAVRTSSTLIVLKSKEKERLSIDTTRWSPPHAQDTASQDQPGSTTSTGSSHLGRVSCPGCSPNPLLMAPKETCLQVPHSPWRTPTDSAPSSPHNAPSTSSLASP